jgi:hypothetical protein
VGLAGECGEGGGDVVEIGGGSGVGFVVVAFDPGEGGVAQPVGTPCHPRPSFSRGLGLLATASQFVQERGPRTIDCSPTGPNGDVSG